MADIRLDPASKGADGVLSPEARARLENRKFLAEFTRLENENKKLLNEVHQFEQTAKKTHAEIKKLDAEIRQLTKPHKTPQFYFSFCTTVLSAIAAFGALYGIGLQRHLAQDEAKEVERESKKIKAELEAKNEALAEQEKQLKKKSQDLKEDFETATTAKKNAEKVIVQFSAFAKAFIKAAHISGTTTDSDDRAVKELLDEMAQRLDYDFLACLLGHEQPEVRTWSALVLSRLDRERIKKIDARVDLANKMVARLVIEKENLPGQRALITAIGRLGRHSIKALLARLPSEEDEPRLNIIRALGEIGNEANSEIVDALIPLLDHQKDRVLQRQVVWSLGKFGEMASKAEPALVHLLPADTSGLLRDSDSYYLSREIISSLGKMNAKKETSANALLRFLDVDGPPQDAHLLRDLRKELLVALGKMGSIAKSAASRVLQIIDKETSDDILQEAAIYFARTDGLAEIRDFLNHRKDPRFVLAGWLGLSEITDETGRKKALEEALKTDNKAFAPAVIPLSKRGKSSLPILADALKMVEDHGTKGYIVAALGVVGTDSPLAQTALIGALKDKDPQLQVQALKSLRKIGQKSPKVLAAVVHIRQETANQPVKAEAQAFLYGMQTAMETKSAPYRLTSTDKEENGNFYQAHKIRFEKGYAYRIDLMSTAFDAFLILKKGDKILAFDDDSGGNLNARLFFEPDETADYEVWATTYASRAVGDYVLEIQKLEKLK